MNVVSTALRCLVAPPHARARVCADILRLSRLRFIKNRMKRQIVGRFKLTAHKIIDYVLLI